MRTDLRNAEVCLYSYGSLVKNGRSAPQCDYVIDVAGFRDPMSNRGFKNTYRDGRPSQVQDYVREDPRFAAILDTVRILVSSHVTSQAADKAWVSIAFRDHHGKWIAPAIVESIADVLSAEKLKVHAFHMDLEG